jgi:UDP-N-acetylmuramoylalanine--D-glutamate ligase
MTLEDLKIKSVAVLGAGMEGKAIISYLVRHGVKPVLFDDKIAGRENLSEADQKLLTDLDIEARFGQSVFSKIQDYEVIFRSPGISSLSPYLRAAQEAGAVITSQTKWFFANCSGNIIGITGTKGKGTTASLIYEMIKAGKTQNVFLTGNIGKTQPLEILDMVKPTDLIVYELSSFQLQDLTQSPHIGVVLMITEDHLDYHSSLGEYHTAKTAVTKFQNEQDFAVINQDNTTSIQIGNMGAGQKYFFSREKEVDKGSFVNNQMIQVQNVLGNNYSFDISNAQLRGQHNYENFCAAVLASLLVGVPKQAIQNTLETFRGLEHRLQFVGEQMGIKFYNDSISTVPATAIAAAKAFSEPLIMILGGSDKHLSYDEMGKKLASLSNLKAVALIGTVAPQIEAALDAAAFQGQIIEAGMSLGTALSEIKKIAALGDVVLLSPAAASLDMFKNYRERGQKFIELMERWSEL